MSLNLYIKLVECNPTCDQTDPSCHAGGQYVNCKVCGGDNEPCHFSPWCWVPTWEPPSDVGEFQYKLINLKNWVDTNKYYNRSSLITE